MTGDILRLGPFTGGLNLASDPSILQNEELVECLNMDLDVDGSLVYRPAIQVYDPGSTGTATKRLLFFGSVVFGGTLYLFATQDGKTFVTSDEGANWTELNPGGLSRECMCMEVYQDTVWLPATPTSANGGMKWTPGAGATAVAAMPRGTDAVVHKNRLYICPGRTAATNGSRLHFSEAADFETWPGTDFIDVNQGDGTTLNATIVYQDNLLLFKDESTYYLAYDLDPSDAVLREVNSVLGVKDKFAVVQYENTVYTIYHGDVYEIVNLDWNLVNLKVPFVLDDALPLNMVARYEEQHISLLGDRLIARYFNRTYVFNLRTRTWSEWRKTVLPSANYIEWHLFGPLIRAHADPSEKDDTYFSGYSFDADTGFVSRRIIKIQDTHTVAGTEGFSGSGHTFDCIVTTKDFDMADPVRFKRLFWWGCDALTGNDIQGDVQPITLQFQPTWNDLDSLTLDDLNTWGLPLSEPSITETLIPGDGNFMISKAFKFLKSMRFRKINFSVKTTTDGTSLEPAKLFSILAVVKTKQVVTQKVN